jgi:lantibiotic modifying enzyme
MSGLAGFAVYGLERLHRASGRSLLERVLDRLEETAQREEGRATWKTEPRLLPASARLIYPLGQHNVGVAHGVPAIVAVLGPMAAAGIGGGRARALLGDAVAWLLDQRREGEDGSQFPAVVGPGLPRHPARFAWCYGDPGVAAALLAAARAVSEASWEREAMAIARQAAAEPTTRSDVHDASLCHGAAGVAHIFNRIHQTTGDPACADAARRWFARALELRRPEGIAGFASWASPDGGSGPRVWNPDPGLLTGATGVALALAAAISSVEPTWDRVLAVSTAAGRGPTGTSLEHSGVPPIEPASI